MIVLGLLTLIIALFSPSGLWGLSSRVRDWPWFPVGHSLDYSGPPVRGPNDIP